MPDHTTLRGVRALGDSLATDLLQNNVLAFLDWGLLAAGGFFDVKFPSEGTRLRPVKDPDYADGRVWEGNRSNWVWESGLPTANQPVGISGVWVDSQFRPYGSGYHINYPLGRVVFDSPLPTSGQVSCEYSFRRVRVDHADAPWFRQLQRDTLDLSREQFMAGSGSWNYNAADRVQLPAVCVEAVSRVRLKPLEVGSKARVHEQDVLLHVIAETPFDRNQLHDVAVNQYSHAIVLFDKNAVGDADRWPLDLNGTPRPSGLNYPGLVEEYPWRTAYITDARAEPQEAPPELFAATCRLTFEFDHP